MKIYISLLIVFTLIVSTTFAGGPGSGRRSSGSSSYHSNTTIEKPKSTKSDMKEESSKNKDKSKEISNKSSEKKKIEDSGILKNKKQSTKNGIETVPARQEVEMYKGKVVQTDDNGKKYILNEKKEKEFVPEIKK